MIVDWDKEIFEVGTCFKDDDGDLWVLDPTPDLSSWRYVSRGVWSGPRLSLSSAIDTHGLVDDGYTPGYDPSDVASIVRFLTETP